MGLTFRWRRDPAQPAPRPSGTDKARAYRRHRRVVRAGQLVMGLAAVVGVVHLLGHLGVFGSQPSGTLDLIAGYPMAGALFILGAVAAGQEP